MKTDLQIKKISCVVLKNMLALMLGCILVIILFVGAEMVFHIKKWVTAPEGGESLISNFDDLVMPHPRYGFCAKPSFAIEECAKRGSLEVYSATYNINQDSMRITPFSTPEKRRCVSLFLGCSFTFGIGVENNETLPALFAENAPDYFPVNAAFSGYGLQQVWLQAADKEFLDKLPYDTGVAIYTFIEHHVDRLIGTPAVLNGWNHPLPWLSENNGKIEFCGTFSDRDPLQYFINRYCRRTHLFKFLENRIRKPETTGTITSEMLDFTARVIMDAAERMHQLRPGIQFWVLFFPDTVFSEEIMARINKSSVKCLDYTHLFDGCGLSKDQLYYRDSNAVEFCHPKAEAYKIVAERLAQDIPPCP